MYIRTLLQYAVHVAVRPSVEEGRTALLVIIAAVLWPRASTWSIDVDVHIIVGYSWKSICGRRRRWAVEQHTVGGGVGGGAGGGAGSRRIFFRR